MGAAEHLTQRPHRHDGQPVGLPHLDIEVEVGRAGVGLRVGVVGRRQPAGLAEHLLVVAGQPEALVEVVVAHHLGADQVPTPAHVLHVRRGPVEVVLVGADLHLDQEALVVLHGRDPVGQPAAEATPGLLDVPRQVEILTAHLRSPDHSQPLCASR